MHCEIRSTDPAQKMTPQALMQMSWVEMLWGVLKKGFLEWGRFKVGCYKQGRPKKHPRGSKAQVASNEGALIKVTSRQVTLSKGPLGQYASDKYASDKYVPGKYVFGGCALGELARAGTGDSISRCPWMRSHQTKSPLERGETRMT